MSDEHDEFAINDPNWRQSASHQDIILLCGRLKATEYEVMLAVEKLTPILCKKEKRYPNEEDIEIFIYALRGE